MASRRPPSRQARADPPPAPIAQFRSRSALAKSSVASKSDTNRPDPNAASSSTSLQPPTRTKAPSSKQQDDNFESNIQVVIRSRRRSEREIQDNSPIIVTTAGPGAHEVTIETSAPSSHLGIVTLPPTRTYSFDSVFGPEADQATVYHDVVHPMLEEVLQGYNCTLFAYGQTGTGKTHTMQGDLTRTPLGNPSNQAGMIPRALFKLFQHLESSGTDYSVRISFVELYNEELRDLLAAELSAPVGSSQPMGLGTGGQTQRDPNAGLKIFDDSSKKSVFIQGLEECPVKDVSQALALLTKGSERRQIAATKFNDHSSRSHSIFSITVHTKETSSMGDDLLRVGKLNLVDLAGSENIGRSGAENKRAREAGMINQSLLTLGRVINALVERSSHVPYRESKLTRLLQDSLGGRTKTCIIATISPARSNLEETMSTLDYAIRAKSIRNKPEVNQRMTRNALLKEYVQEIERLKADLLAAREKNGIFFSEETWTSLNAEHELRLTEVEETKKEIEIIESQLRNVREEFEQSAVLLKERDHELAQTKTRLLDTEDQLSQTEGQLRNTQVALEEEVFVREAHAANELALHHTASSLKTVAHDSVADLAGAFAKIDRQRLQYESVLRTVSNHGEDLAHHSRDLSTAVEGLFQACAEITSKLRERVGLFQAWRMQSIAAQNKNIDGKLASAELSLSVIRDQEKHSDALLGSIRATFGDVLNRIRVEFQTWSQDLLQQTQSLCGQLDGNRIDSRALLDNSIRTLAGLLDNTICDAFMQIDNLSISILDAKALIQGKTDAEIDRLRTQNTLLTQQLEADSKSQHARDKLLKTIAGLVEDYCEDRTAPLRECISGMKKANLKAEQDLTDTRDIHSHAIDGIIQEKKEWVASLQKRAGEGKRKRDGTFKTLADMDSTLEKGLIGLNDSIKGPIQIYAEGLEHCLSEAENRPSEALDEEHRRKRARMEHTDSLFSTLQSGLLSIREDSAAHSKNIKDHAKGCLVEISQIDSQHHSFGKTASSHLSSANQATKALLQVTLHRERLTGDTPQKRQWKVIEHWEVTKDRAALLSENRPRATSPGPTSGSTSSVHSIPGLPIDPNQENLRDPSGSTDDSNPLPTPTDTVFLPDTVTSSIPVPSDSNSGVLPRPFFTRTGSSKTANPLPVGTLADRINVMPNRVTTRRNK